MEQLKILLLLALPASGKSEVRKYLASLSDDVRRLDFHLGPTVDLDDYPYVEFMRHVDEVMTSRLNYGPIFFQGEDRPFADPHEWGTLVELLNDDFRGVVNGSSWNTSPSAANHLFNRIDSAEQRAGARMKLRRFPTDVLTALAVQMEDRARALIDKICANVPETLTDKTIVIEFSRGGPDGADMPLDPPRGYLHSLSHLHPEILKHASILYVWVEPEHSRAKNFERAVPPPGVNDTTLFHGVPLSVMLADYGCDDIWWMWTHSETPDSVVVPVRGEISRLPLVRFDNRGDLTSFVRQKPDKWSPESKSALHMGLKTAMDRLAELSNLR